MKKYIIKGNNYLQGEVEVSGSKNLILPLLALQIVTRKKMIINNVPDIKDVHCFLHIFDYLNITHKWINKHSLWIDSSKMIYKSLTIDEISKIRASYYLIGALLPRYKEVEISYPGGCDFEKRPIDIHLKMFSDFGSIIKEDKNIYFHFDEFKNNEITLKDVSFGATINAILMAIQSESDTVINNISSECEIKCFTDIINLLGGNIKMVNNSLYIKRTQEFKEIEINNIPSRMEVGTFALIGAALGKVRIRPVIREHIPYLEDLFNKSGVLYYFVNDTLVVEKSKKSNSIIVETGVYPAFPTDLQPILTSYLLSIPRIHVIRENIYKNRFSHVEELQKLGAMILKENNSLLINGIFALNGSLIKASDLRGGASLVLAALLANGETIIENVGYIDRGYERFYEKLRNLGADIGVEE